MKFENGRVRLCPSYLNYNGHGHQLNILNGHGHGHGHQLECPF